jgi:O-succinylbenzoic acid--CoA ligase
MEFDLKKLNRKWIAGISGTSLCAQVNVIRKRLQRLTDEEATRGVLITEKDPITFASAFFASVSLNIPIILGNPNWGEQECLELRNLVNPTIVFGQGFAGNTSVGLSHAANAPSPLPPSSILIPTGGSTGGIKLAIHTWDSLAAACTGVQDFLGGSPINSCCVLPLYHVSGLMQLLRAYHSTGYLRFDEDEVSDACVSYVPTQLQRALADSKRHRKLATARAIFVGGAPMSETLSTQARALNLPIVPVYGMTETAAMVAAIPTDAFLANPDAGAQPMGKARIEIALDGRIRIHSPALFKGYHGHPPIDLSQGYLTDDEGSLDQQGNLHVIGRIDRLINSGGEKIDPREIETAVAKLSGVNEVLAVGLPDAEWGQRLVVYYTGTEISNWKEQLKTQLVNYKVPKEMYFSDRLPLDEKGKVTL